MTIQERALEKYPKDTYEDKLLRMVYHSIATEQRDADIEEFLARCVIFDHWGRPIKTKEDLLKAMEQYHN